jgi:hypothetical protein
VLLAHKGHRNQFGGRLLGRSLLLFGFPPSLLKLGLEVLDLGSGSWSNVNCVLFGLAP